MLLSVFETDEITDKKLSKYLYLLVLARGTSFLIVDKIVFLSDKNHIDLECLMSAF